jgi:hypothetical protein
MDYTRVMELPLRLAEDHERRLTAAMENNTLSDTTTYKPIYYAYLADLLLTLEDTHTIIEFINTSTVEANVGFTIAGIYTKFVDIPYEARPLGLLVFLDKLLQVEVSYIPKSIQQEVDTLPIMDFDKVFDAACKYIH